MNLQTARYLAGAAVALLAVSLVALIAVVILRGGVSFSAPSVTGLVAFVGTLVGVMVALLQGQAINRVVVSMDDKLNGQVDKVNGMERKLNGHIRTHDAEDTGGGGGTNVPAESPTPPPVAGE